MKGRGKEEVEKEKGHEKIWSPLLHKAGEEGNGGMRSPLPLSSRWGVGVGGKEKRCKAGDHDEEERKICDSRCLHGKYVRPALAVVKVCENSRIPPSSPPPPQR